MISHVTVGAQHLVVRDATVGMAATRCLEDSTQCTTCGEDLWAGAKIVGPGRRDSRAGMMLKCTCGTTWTLRAGLPLEGRS